MDDTSSTYTEAELAEAECRLSATLSHPYSVGRIVRYINAERARDKSRYVQVRFTASGRLYTYDCRAGEVGGYVVVPPPRRGDPPRLLKVVALGKGTGAGEARAIRVAQRVRPGIAAGSDLWQDGSDLRQDACAPSGPSPSLPYRCPFSVVNDCWPRSPGFVS